MKIPITYRCGHTQVEHLFGGQYDQQRARRARLLCPACYRAKQAAAAAAATAGLPALVGTKRQVAWADQIRATVMAWLSEQADAVAQRAPEHLSQWEAIIDAVTAETRAAWWIGHRHKGAQQIVRTIAEREGLI